METRALDFTELASLRLFLHDLRKRQVASLEHYYDKESGGFYHRLDEKTPGKPSKSSTGTCVLSLLSTNQWKDGPWLAKASELIHTLLHAEWVSAGLDENNLFTVSFILETVSALMRSDTSIVLSGDTAAKRTRAEEILRDAAAERPVALRVQGYPVSAYVAQLVVRTLKKQEAAFTQDADRAISEWCEREINKQIALFSRSDRTADVFQLAYAVILLANLVEPASITPDQEFIIDAALHELFKQQRDDGTWPLSRPLFHYPKVGSAHCYDYEMLVQLLGEPRLREKLLPYVAKLARSAHALRSSFPLGSKGTGWSSGHHPQLRGPESWSTASVYHFAHSFERLLAEQIRIETFAYLGSAYTAPSQPPVYSSTLDDDFLDCEVTVDGQPISLKQIVSSKILQPLIEDEKQSLVESGGKLSEGTPVSIILFGPPGTSKTELAKKLAERLGWPLLTIEPSQFLKHGMDGVYAEADRIFGMLAIAERILVLLDEFDEMVRARETAPDVLSRFLTTAMLPKLHKIHDNRRIVTVVATNHIDWFDVAIRRPGRFDVILQIMPPTVGEKLKKWPDLSALRDKGLPVEEAIEPLTFLETRMLVRRLAGADDAAKEQMLLKARDNCTLFSPIQVPDSLRDSPSASNAPAERGDNQADAGPNDAPRRWKSLCADQAHLSRVH